MPEQESEFADLFDRQIRALEDKLADLDLQIRGLVQLRKDTEDALDRLVRAVQVLKESPSRPGERPRLTIKQAVVRVLERFPGGLTAMSILAHLKTDFGMNYERSSLSPQLSRLKRDGKIKLNGGVWLLNKESA